MLRGALTVFRGLRWRRRRHELENALDDEIRFHIDHQTEKNLRAGVPLKEARRQALIKFGGMARAKEGTRDEMRSAFAENIVRDLRYAWRALLRAPGFTMVTTLTLALGIGATTTMFSVVNGILLRPLPYPEQDRLVELLSASPATYFGYRDHSETFELVGLWDWDSSPVTVTGAGEPQAVQSVEVTHEVLAILGAELVMGRGFTESDDRPGSAPTVIISHGYWQSHFGGDNPVGRTLIVEGLSRQVIGVLAPSFRFFDYPADIFYPRQPVRSDAGFPSTDGRGLARLKEGVTLDEANANVARMIPMLIEEFAAGEVDVEQVRLGLKVRPLKDGVVGDLADTLWVLMGTIGLLLLIACANVVNLVLVRTEARRPELAVRAALGAGWGGIARAVLTENVILGLAGGLAGLGVAYVSLPLLLSLGADDLPHIMTVRIDPTVLLATLAISALATSMFAIVPVFHFALPKLQLVGALHGGRRSMTEGRESNRVRQALVVLQVALALLLLIGSGLMIRTFQMLRDVDPGFRDPEEVQTFQLTIPAADVPGGTRDGLPDREHTVRMQLSIREHLAAVPGVESAAFAAFNDGLPLDGDGRGASIVVEGRRPVEGVVSIKELQFVSPHFFDTLLTTLVAGRPLDWNDVYRGRPVVLVSENLARREWGSARGAVGKRIAAGGGPPWSDIVGVVKDVHHHGLSEPAPETVVFPVLARNGLEWEGCSTTCTTASFVVRSTRVGTPGFLDDLQQAARSVNGNVSLANVQTLGGMYRRSMARTFLTLSLLAITGTMALLLGLIGIYGLVSYTVSQRRREVGIRLALGAARRAVRWMFVRRVLVLVGIGVAIGLGAAAALTRLMASQLYGVGSLDPLTHVAAALVLVTAAALASYLSARRASVLDPVHVLKGE